MTFRRDSDQRGIRKKRFLLYPLLCLGCAALLLSLIPAAVLSVGETGPLRRVSSGDTFILRYTHSMYGVEVREHFRVGPEGFILTQVESSEAALEYFGIERSGPGNAAGTLRSFTLPRASVGGHELLLNGSRIRLQTLREEHDRITVSLVRMSLFMYWMHTLRR